MAGKGGRRSTTWTKENAVAGPGRPRIPDDIKEAARAYTHSALTTLGDVCEGRRMSPSARVAAAQALLDRGYGRPAQAVELSGADGGAIVIQVVTGIAALAAQDESPLIENDSND